MFQAIREMKRYAVLEETAESMTTSPTKDEVPEGVLLFGKYEVRRFIGFGGFAKVYEATNVVTKQSVAVKVVSKRKIVQAGLTEQTEREIAIMRRLRHPHIVHLHEVLATKTKIYFVMEFAKGGELFQKIAAERQFSEDLSRRYFQQLISAVQYCHANGVFHRDLKIDNLLLDEDLNLLVSDFGLSAVKEQTRPDGLLQTLCGTPAYLAPEMLEKKGYDGEKVDVWSCGVVLFALTAGYLPFSDPNVATMLRKIYRGKYRIPSWVSPDLKRLISRLLDPNPTTRITINGILRDPWFRKGYREIKVKQKVPEWEDDNRSYRTKRLNVFDLISFSSGFDMSGLFVTDPEVSDCVERIVSEETPQRIVAAAEEVTAAEGVTVTRKEDGCGAKFEGQDGNLVVLMSIYRLTDELVVVEVKRRGKESGSGSHFWSDKLRSRLLELVHKPETPVIR